MTGQIHEAEALLRTVLREIAPSISTEMALSLNRVLEMIDAHHQYLNSHHLASQDEYDIYIDHCKFLELFPTEHGTLSADHACDVGLIAERERWRRGISETK